jgi:hypothetical protein
MVWVSEFVTDLRQSLIPRLCLGKSKKEKSMNYDTVIASAVRDWSCACEFQRLFANAEHTITQAKRDFEPNGWQHVSEWISRASLYDRYVVWLVVAIEISADGAITELEKPHLYVIEVGKVLKSRDEEEGQEWEDVACIEFEEGDWEKLVASSGDFASVEFEMTVDAPVDRFATFWRDTRPNHDPVPSDGMAFKAPIRFMT